MNTWEYRVAYYDESKHSIADILGAHGAECWELVAIMTLPGQITYRGKMIFKRPNFDNV